MNVYVNSDGTADGTDARFPLSLAGAYVDIPDELDRPPGSPNRSAAKGEWVAYAVSLGHDESEMESLTKDELVDRFG